MAEGPGGSLVVSSTDFATPMTATKPALPAMPEVLLDPGNQNWPPGRGHGIARASDCVLTAGASPAVIEENEQTDKEEVKCPPMT